VHQGQRGFEGQLGEIGEEGVELVGVEHALVDQGPARQAGDVEESASVEITRLHQPLGGATYEDEATLESGVVG